MVYEYRKEQFLISTDPTRLDFDVIHSYLTRSYWTPGIPREQVEKAASNSICFGLYDSDVQIGYARLVTDYVSFAYLADVFVLPTYRGQGLGVWLVDCVVNWPEVATVRSLWLATRDAQELYRKFGFETIADSNRVMRRPQQQTWYQPELSETYPGEKKGNL